MLFELVSCTDRENTINTVHLLPAGIRDASMLLFLAAAAFSPQQSVLMRTALPVLGRTCAFPSASSHSHQAYARVAHLQLAIDQELDPYTLLRVSTDASALLA
eukprot:4164374-Pleurochrysis_carterae.AAC.1